ncbi:hypothetical protein [Pseudoxanthomonas suwonensis]|uniref:hypothetical protein n=1 Tax=Pseudoxanthomonas suwonensis TaxID=314722 RepID=UPI0011872756|nr:hypothetical protein [Pseudoxanthomonas suwonensis]
MTNLPHLAEQARPRRHGVAALASLLVLLLCGWSLLAAPTPGLRTSSTHSRAAGVAAVEAPGDGIPPENLHHYVERKKPRQYVLAPASRGDDPAIQVALPLPGAGDPSAPPPASFPGQAPMPHGVPAFANAPQLRLHPGQAPPTA